VVCRPLADVKRMVRVIRWCKLRPQPELSHCVLSVSKCAGACMIRSSYCFRLHSDPDNALGIGVFCQQRFALHRHDVPTLLDRMVPRQYRLLLFALVVLILVLSVNASSGDRLDLFIECKSDWYINFRARKLTLVA
jgi:hypothetical protein